MARKMFSITGQKAYGDRIGAVASARVRKDVSRAVYVGADQIRVEARRRIADGAIQGSGHVPAKPPNSPNWDTGNLANSIITYKEGEYIAVADSQAQYAAAMEYGFIHHMNGQYYGPWPYMAPAADTKRGEIASNIAKVYSKAIVSVRAK